MIRSLRVGNSSAHIFKIKDDIIARTDDSSSQHLEQTKYTTYVTTLRGRQAPLGKDDHMET